MPLINDALFHDEWMNNAGFRAALQGWCRNIDYNYSTPVQADRQSAVKAQAMLRKVFVEKQQQMHKALRPWDLTNKALDHLNRNEPWWGFEFETGWKSSAARGKALAFTYDNIDGVMYDGEGEGGYPVEITFLPEERSKYLDGTSNAHKFVDWMNDNPQLIAKGVANDVGTHLNMSHPSINTPAKASTLAKFLNRTLHHTVKVNGQRKKMFGRERIYAGFFPQFAGGNAWVEFKGYRTAYTREEFDNYIKSAEALQKCIDLYVDNPRNCTAKCVTNLYDVAYNGAEPELVWWDGPLPLPANGERLHTRYNMGEV